MTRSLFSLAALLLACAALAAPAPEPFVSGWSKPVDPDRNCKISYNSGALFIEMPGSDHDYDPIRRQFNAPRIVRELERNFDMQVRVRIDCRPSAQSTDKGQPSLVAAGFLLMYPESNRGICSRLELKATRTGNDVEGCVDLRDWLYVGEDPKSSRFRMEHPDVKILERNVWRGSGKGWKSDAYLRLDRQAGILGFYASSDGKNWKLSCGMAIGSREKLKVGLSAFSTSSELSKVRFDQLKLTRGKKKEPLKEPLFGPSIYKASLSLPSFP